MKAIRVVRFAFITMIWIVSVTWSVTADPEAPGNGGHAQSMQGWLGGDARMVSSAPVQAAEQKTVELAVAIAQPLVVPGDIANNVANMEPLVSEAARRGAKVIVFSECGITGYDLKGVGSRAAITLDDPILEKIAQMARKNHVAIVAGFHEKAGEKLHNSAIALLPDGKRVVQRKNRILPPEHAIAPIVAAERSRTVFEIAGVRCALLICSDAGIPGIMDELTQAGCDAVILLTAGGGDESFGMRLADVGEPGKRKDYARKIVQVLSSESIEHLMRLDLAQIACNQSGWDPKSGYFHTGGSSIIDRTGRVSAVIPPCLIFECQRPELAVGTITAKRRSAER